MDQTSNKIISSETHFEGKVFNVRTDRVLLDLGFEPNRLSAAGYGEFYPITDGETDEDLQQNRRIELKLTSR